MRQYGHVLALADHASSRKASEALGIAQPALTKSLFQLEREVGQRLFDRHGQTISPNVFGAIAVDTARKILDSQEAMTRAIGQTAALDAGELAVGVGPCTADTCMGQVSGRLLQRHPRFTHLDRRRAVGESPARPLGLQMPTGKGRSVRHRLLWLR